MRGVNLPVRLARLSGRSLEGIKEERADVVSQDTQILNANLRSTVTQ